MICRFIRTRISIYQQLQSREEESQIDTLICLVNLRLLNLISFHIAHSFRMSSTSQFCLFVTIVLSSILLQSTNAFALTQTTRWSARSARLTHLSMADGEKNTENSLMDVLSGTSPSFVGAAENRLHHIISHIISP